MGSPSGKLFETLEVRKRVLGDDLLERAIEAIQNAARTGRIGDGKIFISEVEQAIRIRTGETGADAL